MLDIDSRLIARAAARADAQFNDRATASTFDASIRVVGAGLAVSIIPRVIVERARAEGVSRSP